MIVSRWMSFCERMFWVLLVKMGLLLMFFRIFSNTFVKIALIMRILCIFPSQNIPRKILKEKGPGLRSLYSTWSPKNEQNHYKLYIWRRERERERVGDWRVQKEMRRCKTIHYVVLNPNPFGSFLFFQQKILNSLSWWFCVVFDLSFFAITIRLRFLSSIHGLSLCYALWIALNGLRYLWLCLHIRIQCHTMQNKYIYRKITLENPHWIPKKKHWNHHLRYIKVNLTILFPKSGRFHNEEPISNFHFWYETNTRTSTAARDNTVSHSHRGSLNCYRKFNSQEFMRSFKLKKRAINRAIEPTNQSTTRVKDLET